MKKTKFWAILMMAVCTMGVVSACGDDDDEDGGGSGSVPSPQIKSPDGTAIRLTSIGTKYGTNRTFQYDSDGRLTGFGSSEFNYTLTDGNFSASYGDDETVTGSIKFETNGKGFVTKIIADVYSKVSDGSWTKTKSNTTFSYDGDGQLTSGSATGTVEGYNDDYGGNYSETGSGKVTYTWAGGNLVQIVDESTESISVGGMSVVNKSNEIVKFTYGSEQNQLRQNPVWNKGVEDLDLIGLFGVGPVNLPVSSTSEYKEYEGGELDLESAYETTHTFTLNNNGTLDTQTDKSKNTKSSYGASGGTSTTTYYFGYDGKSTRSAVVADGKRLAAIARAVNVRLFRSHREKAKKQ